MKTALQITEIVRQHLRQSSLFTDADRPNGNTYSFKYPSGSDREDVTISALANVPSQELGVSEGILVVNVFVPNLVITQGGKQDRSLPNVPRLAYLSQLSINALNEVWALSGEYNFTVQQETLMEDDESNKHFVSIRVEFYSINN